MQPLNTSYGKLRVLKALRHWSPLIILSLIANVGLLYVFVFLIAVAEPIATEKNRINVRIVQSQPQESKVSPKPKVPDPVKPPKAKDKVVKKTKPTPPKPEMKPAPPEKVVQAKIAEPPPPPPQKPDEPAKTIEVTEKEVPESLNHEQVEVNDQDKKPSIASVSPPQAPIVSDVVPLFRLTRMPKVVDYNLETLKRFYPEDERDFGKEATVEAMILVDENGDIREVEILKSAGASFDAAAKKALLSKALVIQPGYIGNKPVASRVPIPITFNLTE